MAKKKGLGKKWRSDAEWRRIRWHIGRTLIEKGEDAGEEVRDGKTFRVVRLPPSRRAKKERRMMPTELQITEGSVRLSQVLRVMDNDDCKAWEVDCRTKYPGTMVGSGDDDHDVILYATERTLHAAETDAATVISLPLKWDEWQVVVDSARYTVRIVAVRRRGGEVVWYAGEVRQEED